MANYDSMNSRDLLIGAAAGGLIGAVAALLMAPESGEDLRDDICDTYCNVSNKGKSLAKSISDSTRCMMDHVSCGINKWNCDDAMCAEEECCDYTKMLVGAAAGIGVGAIAGLLMAPKAGNRMRKDLSDAYDDMSDKAQDFAKYASKKGNRIVKNARSQVEDWADIAQQVVSQFTDGAHDRTDEVIERVKEMLPRGKASEVADWAAIGFRLWKGLQKSRR